MFNDIRSRIYEIIELAQPDDRPSQIYDSCMIIIILISIIPLGMKHISLLWLRIDDVCVTIFIIDYILRLLTADYKMRSHTVSAFLRYPLTPLAMIDLISILPHFIVINKSFKLFRLIRLTRALRVVRIFKIYRYSDNIAIIASVIRRSKESLITVGALTVGYIMATALIMLNVEPETFDDLFDAIYWATVSMTTIGYGDIIPATTVGKMVTVVSSFFGIGVIALPAGIITAGFMEEIRETDRATRLRIRKQKKIDKYEKFSNKE